MSDCPVYLETGEESLGPRGRLSLIEAYVRGELGLTNRFKDIMSKCLLCGACSDSCVAGVSTHEVIHCARAKIREGQKIIPLKWFLLEGVLKRNVVISGLFREVLRVGRFFHPLTGIPSPVRPGLINNCPSFIRGHEGGLKIGCFVGCITDQFFPEVGQSAINILKDCGCTIYIPKGQQCCGLPFFNCGDVDEARSLAMHNIEIFLSQGDVDYIITACGACSSHLKDYKKLIGHDPRASTFSLKVKDISELLVDELSYTKRLRDRTGHSKASPRVTYHDPCHLKRRQKIFREPRQLINALTGIEFVEMNSPDRCCGYGGNFNLNHRQLSLKILKHKTDDIKKTGAQVVATGCMGCLLQLKEGVVLEGLSVEVLHIAQLIERCKNDT